MLLHFKINCFIFVMLVGQINLGEKVSSNIDAFFDPSVDDLQDNFYDIPFIPSNHIQNERKNYDQLDEQDVFLYGREKLNVVEQKINKRHVKTKSTSNASSNTLFNSIIEKSIKNGKEKTSLHLRMQDIEDDEAVLEKGSKQRTSPSLKTSNCNVNGNHRVKRNIFEDLPVSNRKRRHKYINSIYFSHKYRHKKHKHSDLINDDVEEPEEALQISKRMFVKRSKKPQKHRTYNTYFQSNKHEAFKDNIDNEPNNVKIDNGDEHFYKNTNKHKENNNESTKKKQNQITSTIVSNQAFSKVKSEHTEETTSKKTNASKNQQVTSNTPKTIIPPTKPSIKSILSRKNQKPSTTTATVATTDSFGEYEDYKAGDYIETEKSIKHKHEGQIEFREKRDENQTDDIDECGSKNKNGNGNGNQNGAENNLIDNFLRSETTLPSVSGQKFIQSPVGSTKKYKQNAIEQFLKDETTKCIDCTKKIGAKRGAHLDELSENFDSNSDDDYDDEDHVEPDQKKKYQNEIDRFLNGEIPKTKIFQYSDENPGATLHKHKEFMKSEKNINNKTPKNKNEFLLKQQAVFNNDRVYKKKMKERLQPETFKQFRASEYIEDPDFYEIIEKTERSRTPQKPLEQKVFVVESENEEMEKSDDECSDENEDTMKPNVKLKQRLFLNKPEVTNLQNENVEDGKKLEVLQPNNEEEFNKDSPKNNAANEKYSGKNSLKKIGDKANNGNGDSKKIGRPPVKHLENDVINKSHKIEEAFNEHEANNVEVKESEIIDYIKQMIKNQKKLAESPNKNVVKIKEMNKKLGIPNESPRKKPSPKIYVAHTKNEGRQHHRVYFDQDKLKAKSNTKKEHQIKSSGALRSKYEKILGRDELHAKKETKHQVEAENEDDLSGEEKLDIEALYSEIPVNRKHIQLSLNCDGTNYKNKDHCICSVKTMLRDLMDDLKDINGSMNYQYDCSKYIGIEPGVVIANDSRMLMSMRDKRDIYFDNFLLRKGSRIGRDVETLLNDNLNIDDLDKYIYATVGSKVVLHCGNSSGDYSEDDKIVWTVQHGSPETAGFKEDNGRELILERVSAQDTNNYTCTISHRLEDGNYGPSKKFLHKLSVVELPVYSLMVTVVLNESTKCEQDDLETLHNYYPVMLNKFLCHGAEKICRVSIDTPHCTKSYSDNGVTMHVTLKTNPLFAILPTLRKKQETCGINCESRIYSIIVKTLQNNFASVANLPVFFRDSKGHKKFVPIQYDLGDESNMFSNSILTICPQGFGIFQQNEKLCLTCEPHTYNPGSKKNCIPCPSGSYQPIYGAGSCLPCMSPLDDARCLFGPKAELAPKLYFIIPIILVVIIIIIIVYCVYVSMKQTKNNEVNADYLSGKNNELPENIQTKVIEQVFTGEPSEKSYSTIMQRQKRKSQQQQQQKSVPLPPPVDFN